MKFLDETTGLEVEIRNPGECLVRIRTGAHMTIDGLSRLFAHEEMFARSYDDPILLGYTVEKQLISEHKFLRGYPPVDTRLLIRGNIMSALETIENIKIGLSNYRILRKEVLDEIITYIETLTAKQAKKLRGFAGIFSKSAGYQPLS